MTGYVRKLVGNTTMSFNISNKKLLKKYNQIWKRVGKLLEIELDSKRVYGDDEKCIKTTEKIHIWWQCEYKFSGQKMPKEKAPCSCLTVIMLDSVIKAKKKLYPQTLLEECKYEQKRVITENLTDDDLEKSLSDNDYNDEMESDDESSE